MRTRLHFESQRSTYTNSRAVSLRRTLASRKPVAVARHLRALLGRSVPPAARKLRGISRGTPAKLGAIVRVIGHLERRSALDDIAEREALLAAIRARVAERAPDELALEQRV